jgi:hypothetical protein
MRYLSVVLMALAFLGFATISPAQEKQAQEKQAQEKQAQEKKVEQKTAEAKVVLPEAVAKAVKDNCPKAVIEKTDLEEGGGVKLYDIEFKDGMGEIEVAEDGTVMDVSTVIEMKDVPEAAAEAIRKAAKGASIKQIEKSEVRGELKREGEKVRIVKLDKSMFLYEAELVKGDQRGEIQVAPDGKIVEAVKWEEVD